MNCLKQPIALAAFLAFAAGAYANDSARDNHQSKVIFIQEKGAYCPVVNVHRQEPIIRTHEGLAGPISTEFTFIIKEGNYASKGDVLITSAHFQPPPMFYGGTATGKVAFIPEEDHAALYLVTYLVKKDSQQIDYFWFKEIGPVKADKVAEVSTAFEGLEGDSLGIWPGYELQYQFYEAGFPLATYQAPES